MGIEMCLRWSRNWHRVDTPRSQTKPSMETALIFINLYLITLVVCFADTLVEQGTDR